MIDEIFLRRRLWRFPAFGRTEPEIYAAGDTLAAVQYAELLDRSYCSMHCLPDGVDEASVIELDSALASIVSAH